MYHKVLGRDPSFFIVSLRKIRTHSMYQRSISQLKTSLGLLKNTSKTVDAAFEKTEAYKGEFEGASRSFDPYYNTPPTKSKKEK